MRWRPQAHLEPPNAEADWVVVDVIPRELDMSSSASLLSEVQDDAKSLVRVILRDKAAELSVVLTSDQGIRTVNSEWRGVDASTDVLAFPQDDPDGVVLGDVVISVETAKRQASNENVRDEIRVLMVHGVLHLLGYDHEGKIDGDWLVMARMENRVMKQLGWQGQGLVAAITDDRYKDVIDI